MVSFATPSDPYADITEQQVAEAEVVESRVRKYRTDADLAHLRMGYFLRLARDRKLFRARGFDSFRDWVESPDVDLPYRKAQDLIRLVERLEPLLGSNLLVRLGATKARALLPLVEIDEHGAVANGAEVLSAARDIQELNWQDAHAHVRELRSRPARLARRARFLASTRSTDRRSRLVLQVAQGDRLYVAGELSFEPQHAEAFMEALKATSQQ